ncbi:hypothetical protein B0H14DRAFT_2350040 [Mycena olivaceomarginata]|nr:hypothetical protein B0H14DRAFT_2350040 [Mycena olivaceomarginata]
MAELTEGHGLWFYNDSFVVLCAEDHIFRVPKSILAARSSVFQSMFEFPQPTSNRDEMADGEEMIDVKTRGDTANVSLACSYFMPPSNIGSREVLRLTHKYDVSYLYQRGIPHLETIYPTSLGQVGQMDATVI